MPSINEIQDEIIEEFSELDDWMDRYQLLIDMGNEQQPLPAEDKNDQNLIDGCQSRLWLACSQNEDGTLCFRAESAHCQRYCFATHTCFVGTYSR